jgi:predicted cation transporter
MKPLSCLIANFQQEWWDHDGDETLPKASSMSDYAVIALGLIVLLLPLVVKKVGDQLELFLFFVGALAVTVTSQWSIHLALDALVEPLKITGAVLVAGLLFHFLRAPLHKGIGRMRIFTGLRTMSVALVILVGLVSSFITAIIASVVLVEIVRSMHLPRKTEIRLVVLACFSIGLGAALTPFGEPLATIVVSKLSGAPYHAGFWFLLKNLWMYVIPGIALCGLAAVLIVREGHEGIEAEPEEGPEKLREVFIRTAKVYIFVYGLVLLGTGFTPLIDRYAGSVSYLALFWVNMLSAVLDNATLTAAEIVPAMEIHQIVAALLGLLIAGGMLVPGNIPNIISAGRLKISAQDWAKIGVPFGMALMAGCFAALLLVR